MVISQLSIIVKSLSDSIIQQDQTKNVFTHEATANCRLLLYSTLNSLFCPRSPVNKPVCLSVRLLPSHMSNSMALPLCVNLRNVSRLFFILVSAEGIMPLNLIPSTCLCGSSNLQACVFGRSFVPKPLVVTCTKHVGIGVYIQWRIVVGRDKPKVSERSPSHAYSSRNICTLIVIS